MVKINISGKWNFKAGEYEGEIGLPDTLSAAGIGAPNTEKNTGYLTDPYIFEGDAVYSRKVVIDNYSPDKIYMLYLERTRMARVLINGKDAGSSNSLCTPHRYDITAFAAKEFELTVIVSNTDYPTRGGHMTSPDTQTNWNGILGEMYISAENKGVLRDITVIPDREYNSVIISARVQDCRTVEITSDGAFDGIIADVSEDLSVTIPCRDDIEIWDEFSHKTYNARLVTDSGNEYKIVFGMISLKTFKRENGSYGFKANGRETFMRGKHDGMIFPLTGYAPMDINGWLKVMGTAKDYGINHYRFHTCCPPDAAFSAADMLGVYMEPELPFWGTVHGKDDKDFNASEQEYLISEGERIIREYGHHPSFVMFSLGNELWGSADRLDEIIRGLKKINDNILYTSGSNNFQFYPTEVPSEDFFAGVRFDREFLIRGSYAMCDAPQGFIQTEKPTMSHDYDVFFSETADGAVPDENGEIEIQYGTGVKKVKTNGGSKYIPKKPVISHEVGQYVTYPDFDGISKYTGVLKPRNFEVLRDRLIDAGMGDYARDNFINSGMLAAQCYKLEIEAARRSKCLSGYQLLDIQDFTGQGTALVGILDAFMESKGIISCEEWNYFNSADVILAAFDSFVIYDGDKFSAEIILSHYSNNDISEMTAEAEIFGEKFFFNCKCVNGNGVFTLGRINIDISATEQKTAAFSLSMGDIKNEYTLYAFPKKYLKLSDLSSDRLLVTDDKKKALFALSESKNVLLVTDKFDGLETEYCTDFWCYPMFRSISESMKRPLPIGTLGLSVRSKHKALSGFISDTYTTPQWYDIIKNGRGFILDGVDCDPIVRIIDNFERNKKAALLFEAKCSGGKLILCGLNSESAENSPEISAYLKSIADYADSEDFDPSSEITADILA